MRTRVAAVGEVPPGTMLEARLQGRPIVVANADGELFAFQNACLHYGVRLSEGCLDGQMVTCRWHQWRYHLGTGRVVSDESPYATFTTFPVVVESGEVFVEHEPRTRITRHHRRSP
jgi:nitrite reductase/ring-hydroxylating ferredoxin subunit